MKKILFVLAFAFIGQQVFSQTVNDVPIKDIDVAYVQIVGYSKLMSTKLNIQIDFGQETSIWTKGAKTVVRDVNGKIMKFNSMIDALNFMNNNGYEFETAYAFAIGNQNVYHYLLKKQ